MGSLAGQRAAALAAYIRDDAEKPGAESRPPFEFREAFVDLNPYVLGGFIGFRDLTAEELRARALHELTVALYKILVGGIGFPTAGDRRGDRDPVSVVKWLGNNSSGRRHEGGCGNRLADDPERAPRGTQYAFKAGMKSTFFCINIRNNASPIHSGDYKE